VAHVVTLLGGESTGKTTLALALHDSLRARGLEVVLVAEHLRHWCERARRAPRQEEQAELAREQARLIEAAARRAQASIVIADTSPLVIAAYSELYFNDTSLAAEAIDWQREHADLSLVMGLDLPWVADGLFRDSPAMRDATDAVLRRLLQAADLAFQSIYGDGPARNRQALRAVGHLMALDLVPDDPGWAGGRRPWSCETCSDPDCEHTLFSSLVARHTSDNAPP
jgi:HTH-type transcriptional regulator, transcriptional repressor of NAD biosynthesis genes